MDRETVVYVHLGGKPHLAGRLWARVSQESGKREFRVRQDLARESSALLYRGQQGWRLSPAYDLNPMPVDIKPRILTTAINEDDGTASLDLAMSVADYFELAQGTAQAIAAQVGKVVSTWRDEAARHGLTKTEINRVATAFEHDDLKKARGK